MVIRDILLILLNVGVILRSCQAGCIPQNKGSGSSLFDIEEGEKQNSRPNIFMDADRLTGGVSKEKQHTQKHHVDFMYGSGANGPASWYKLFPKCAGPRQSPIDIPISSIKNVHEKRLTWNNAYSEIPLSISVMNIGHTVVLNAVFKNTTDPPSICGGPLVHTYTLAHIHFHWGSKDHAGSEHTIDGKSFPMEMHAVHHRSDMTFQNASSSPKGLAVIGYIFEIEKPCTDPLDYIIERIGMLKMEQDTPVTLNNMFKLNSLIDMFTSDYVSYEGSLTVPPCHESVTWIISPYTISISAQQLTAFRSLYASTPSIKNNYRPVQPLNGRNITYIVAK